MDQPTSLKIALGSAGIGAAGIGAGLFMYLQKTKISLLERYIIEQQTAQLNVPRGEFGFARALSEETIS